MNGRITFIEILYKVALFLSVPIALFSIMIFDSPGAQRSDYTQLLFWSIFLLPASLFCALVFSKETKNKIFLLLPALNIIAFVFASWAINVYQHGSFTP